MIKRYVLVTVLIVSCTVAAFAQPEVQLSLDFGLPLAFDNYKVPKFTSFKGFPGFEREVPETKVNESLFAFGTGINARVFWPNNVGAFLDLTFGFPFSYEQTSKQEGASQDGKIKLDDYKGGKLLFSAAVGAAYRLPLGTMLDFYAGAGPTWRLVTLGGLESGPHKITSTSNAIGLLLNPGVTFKLGPSLFLDAGVNLDLNFFRTSAVTYEFASGTLAAAKKLLEEDAKARSKVESYFGFQATPYVGVGYSF